MTFSESDAQLLRGAAPAGALLLGLALEWLRPHAALHPAWRANLGLWLASTLLVSAACGACGFAVAGWAEARGIGLLNALAAPTLVGVAVSVLALDAVSWAWHLANHRVPFLWRFHRVHHADEAFHVTTALRFHPGEILLALPLRLAAVVALGAPPLAIVLFEALFGVANVLEHGNFDVARKLERALGRALITPAQHRFHHVLARPEAATNFGTIFSLWDRLARTHAASVSTQRFATGVPGVSADPTSLGAMLVEPLRRA